MEFFCFALPPAWKDTHPAGTDPREPVESWLWLELHDWADPEDLSWLWDEDDPNE